MNKDKYFYVLKRFLDRRNRCIKKEAEVVSFFSIILIAMKKNVIRVITLQKYESGFFQKMIFIMSLKKEPKQMIDLNFGLEAFTVVACVVNYIY
jgi:hypothetical protein